MRTPHLDLSNAVRALYSPGGLLAAFAIATAFLSDILMAPAIMTQAARHTSLRVAHSEERAAKSVVVV